MMCVRRCEAYSTGPAERLIAERTRTATSAPALRSSRLAGGRDDVDLGSVELLVRLDHGAIALGHFEVGGAGGGAHCLGGERALLLLALTVISQVHLRFLRLASGSANDGGNQGSALSLSRRN